MKGHEIFSKSGGEEWIFFMKEWGGVRSRTKEATDIVFMASLRFLPDGFPEDK